MYIHEQGMHFRLQFGRVCVSLKFHSLIYTHTHKTQLQLWKKKREAQAVKIAQLVDLALIKVDWAIPEHRSALRVS